MKEQLKKYFDIVSKWGYRIIGATCLLIVIYAFISIFCIATFKIPSDSMEPALRMGDYILVEKLSMGARLFDLNAAFENKKMDIHRVPGLGSLRRNDIVVFNFPYPTNRWDSIGFNIMLYYVKRCIALPGDTLEIRNAHYRINGSNEIAGNIEAQDYLARLFEKKQVYERGIVVPSYPRDKKLGWTIRELGPFYIPQKGDTVCMDRRNFLLYKPVIEWEQEKKLCRENDSIITLGGKAITEYCFQKSYCFVSGDRMVNSKDSRYWGLLPEEFIVGKVWLIWKSIDEYGEIRWDRVMNTVR